MRVVFSYDCEGNWGFVDWPEVPFTNERQAELTQIYQSIISLHQKYEIPATFGFVGLYIMPEAERLAYIDEHYQNLKISLPNLTSVGGCWEGTDNFDIVAEASGGGMIEIGSHSLTHRPMTELSREDCQFEFSESHRIICDRLNADIRSFIFPRNHFAHVDLCNQKFQTYRSVPIHTRFARGGELLRTITGMHLFNEQQISDFIFFNGGLRRRLTDAGWKRCWVRRLQRITRKPKLQTVHAWSHPHNALTDPHLLERIEWLLMRLAENREHIDLLPLSSVSPDGSESQVAT